MKAEKKAWCEGTRVKLSDALPLKTPLSISFEASSFCNLKCNYCVHGIEDKNLVKRLLDLDYFKDSVDSLTRFPNRIKNILFALNGEPLINSQLPQMIKYIKQKDVADNVTVFTNAVLLTPEFGKKLIDAGLDLLRVSIQGISDKNYKNVCGVSNIFDKIISNLTAFYNYKRQCRVFIKIVDKGLNGPEDKSKFYQIFGDICDEISIETVVPIRLEVDYQDICESGSKNMLGQKVMSSDVCAQPFYSMYVHSNNNVTPCCLASSQDLIIGNIQSDSLFDIWNSLNLWDIRKMQLKKERYFNPICKSCNGPLYASQNNDNIDDSADRILEIMSKRKIYE